MPTGSTRPDCRRRYGSPLPGAVRSPAAAGEVRMADPADLAAILLDPFDEFGFMRRALAGCLALSLGSAPVGVILMLRRMSLTGDAMAHAILPGAAVGYLVAGLSLSAMTLGGVVAGLLVTLTAAFVARSSRQS